MSETNVVAGIGKLAAALAKAQSQMSHAEKSKKNEHFKSRYADLAAVLDAVGPALSANELALVQLPVLSDDKHVSVTTMLIHSSGESLSSTLAVPVSKQDAQGVGSAITYARRYAVMAMCGIAPDDDDGNAAVGRAPSRAPDADDPMAKEVALLLAGFTASRSLDDLAALLPRCKAFATGTPERATLVKAYNAREAELKAVKP